MADLRLSLHVAATLAIGAGAAFLFQVLGLPAPFLTGPALCVTAAALFGLKTSVPKRLQELCFLVLGLGIGAGLTPEVIGAAMTWPLSFLALTIVLFVTISVNVLLFTRLFDFPKDEATLAAVPGLLSYTLAIAEERGMNVARVSLVQTMRVLFLTLLVPPVMGLFGAELTLPESASPLGTTSLVALLILGGLFGVFLLKKNAPAAIFLAGFAVSGVAHVTEFATGGLPPWLGIAAFTVIGTMIGSRFRGVTLADLRALALAGIVMTVVSSLVALTGGVIVALFLGLPPAALFISFAPGGLEVMIALAAQLGVDGTFVAAHHIARLLILMVLVPVMLRRLRPAGTRPE